MKVFELSNELNVNNKELITFFKEKGFKVSSHLQNITDEMIDLARSEVKPTKIQNEEKKETHKKNEDKNNTAKRSTKVFKADDEIICKSVTPWKLTAVGVDKNTVYHWEYFGDVDYVKYRDLQALRRTDYITKPNIIIMDEDLRSQWSRELGDVYKYFDGEYTLEEATEKIKQNSRHYAKRQYTFFNHQMPVVWFETDYDNFDNTIKKVSNCIDSNCN